MCISVPCTIHCYDACARACNGHTAKKPVCISVLIGSNNKDDDGDDDDPGPAMRSITGNMKGKDYSDKHDPWNQWPGNVEKEKE